MTDSSRAPGPDGPASDVDEIAVRESKGVPIVWIIPLVAIAIGGWLWIQALRERGPTIQISFVTAEGLVAGKSSVKYKDIEVGKVTTIDFNEDASRVLVTVEMELGAKRFILESARFWVVRPRIGAGGVSGLGTILSGAYIGVEPGLSGADAREFTGLEEPPLHASDDGGLRINLMAEEHGSLRAGTPIYFRQTHVGDVERVQLHTDGEKVQIEAYIDKAYKHFLTGNCRFWDTSGLRATMGADGIQVQMESLDALLTGGLAFGLPADAPAGQLGAPVEAGTLFHLFPDRESASLRFDSVERWVLFFDESVRGLAPGAPVEFRGIRVGEVVEVRPLVDFREDHFWIPVVIKTHPTSFSMQGIDVNLSKEERVAKFRELGLYARLETGSLLTGSKFIDCELDPDVESRLTGLGGDLYEVPTAPSSGEKFSEAMERLPEIVANLDRISGDVANLLESDQTKETLDSIQRTAGGVEALIANVNGEIDPILTGLRQALDDADQLLASANGLLGGLEADRPELEHRVNDALSELSAGLRSLRSLTDYLERHPEALLKGKGGE